MADLLLDGDVEGRYPGRDDSHEGYRLTMALAVGASQPGRAWKPADFHYALLYAPTEGGSWARRLRANKGTEYAEGKLTGMLLKAREFVDQRPAITCRASGWEAVERHRNLVDDAEWPTKGGGDTDLKNLTVRLAECERGGGLDHELSLRRQAELMGCAKQTAANSNRRLMEKGWLRLRKSGAGSEQGSQWRLTQPREEGDMGAGPGHPPTSGLRGGRDGVPGVHTDTKALARLVGDDAFHRYGHGTSGARLLVLLDPVDGLSATALQGLTGLHRTTIARRTRALVEDGLAVEVEGLFYLAPSLAGPAGLDPTEAALRLAAEARGTAGFGERRRRRHARDRRNYRLWRSAKKEKRREERRRIVPEGVVSLVTGEIVDREWLGWDVSDPYKPVPLPGWAAA
ncbi:hypothetical protein [Streptomyces sp. NPDC088707]|uniref:hypothetical protein n=1 Tax=Streptomyces sp. NPDC088707 TaxID=3365871 RepID=UPI003816D00D